MNGIHFRVISADIDDARLELSKKMGSDLTVNTLTHNLKEVDLYYFDDLPCNSKDNPQ